MSYNDEGRDDDEGFDATERDADEIVSHGVATEGLEATIVIANDLAKSIHGWLERAGYRATIERAFGSSVLAKVATNAPRSIMREAMEIYAPAYAAQIAEMDARLAESK